MPKGVDPFLELERKLMVPARVRQRRLLVARLVIAVDHNDRVCRRVPCEGHLGLWQNKTQEITPGNSATRTFK